MLKAANLVEFNRTLGYHVSQTSTNGILHRRQRRNAPASQVLSTALKYMANSSHIPASGLHEVRSNPVVDHTPAPLRTVTSEMAAPPDTMHPLNGNALGPRKLVRPTLPARTLRERLGTRSESPISAHNTAMLSLASQENAHAEAFYFQKQVQAQTQMVFVLEDGERIEGYIEWYDRDVIKVRNGGRTMIYKSSIKYLYKAGDTHA